MPLYTSDNQGLLARTIRNPDKLIWDQIRDNLQDSDYFIACLSDDYFQREWCIAELTVFRELLRESTRKRDLILLELDANCPRIKSSPFTGGYATQSLSSPGTITALISNLRELGIINNPPDAAAVAVSFKEALHNRSRRDVGYLAELPLQYFARTRHKGPLTALVSRDQYQEISINLGKQATRAVVWSVFGSPLLMAQAYRPGRNYLMNYDQEFERFDSQSKTRLVIFHNSTMAKAYATCDLAYHQQALGIRLLSQSKLQGRRDAFETSVTRRNGDLLFTTIPRLSKALKQPLTKRSYLEFAYYEGNELPGNLIVDSGFSSSFRTRLDQEQQRPTEVRHINFFPNELCEHCYPAMLAWPYKSLLGHYTTLRGLADGVECSARDESSPYVKSGSISELFELT